MRSLSYSDFERVDGNTLLTPIILYKRGDSTVKSIATLHVGSAGYYKALQDEIDRTGQGFYEGMEETKGECDLPFLRRLLSGPFCKMTEDFNKKLAEYTGMECQTDALSYPSSWFNVDITVDEMISRLSIKELLQGLADCAKFRLYKRFLRLNQERLSHIFRQFARHIYFEGRESSPQGSESENLMVESKNQVLFEALDPMLDRGDCAELGLVYSTGHMPGIDDFLKARRFVREGERWVPAWEDVEPLEIVKAIMGFYN